MNGGIWIYGTCSIWGKLKVKYMYESRHMSSESRHVKLRTLNLQMISKLCSKQLVLMH